MTRCHQLGRLFGTLNPPSSLRMVRVDYHRLTFKRSAEVIHMTPLSNPEIDEIEKSLGHKLPGLYRRLLFEMGPALLGAMPKSIIRWWCVICTRPSSTILRSCSIPTFQLDAKTRLRNCGSSTRPSRTRRRFGMKPFQTIGPTRNGCRMKPGSSGIWSQSCNGRRRTRRPT